ncbi:cupredoxin family protein [Hyphomicrobium sp.]|jgi:uncharacterized cupredoxin-like copper-binding protein|uniref:cupredoxin domain-containing protein n=1 Tax=Hyphomicrobium sp. TaxID=82 RepID=UPI0025BE0518|nr:cupredoxin family protein [Hyphomicrobium sp.]
MRTRIKKSKCLLLMAATLALPFAATIVAAEPGETGHTHKAFDAGEPGDPAKPARTIAIAMTEGNGAMAYDPHEVIVKTGEQVKFVITNSGALDHEFMLDSVEKNAKHRIAMQKNPEMEHDDPNGRRLKPGGSAEIVWKFSKAGTFEFACLIPGHSEAGMKGVVVVSDK